MRVARTIAAAVIVLLILAAIGTAGAVLVVRRSGLAADRPPGAIETAIARRVVLLSIPAGARASVNPEAADANAWRQGAEHFADHCAFCHGADGRGQTDVGRRMYPPVPDLASDAVQRLSDGALFWIVQNGIRWTGMPAFRASHDAQDTWQLVSFIRRIPALPAHPAERGHEHADHGGVATNTVAIDGTAFAPDTLTIAVGQTVTWINRDPFPHDVTSTAGGFSSGAIEPDARWAFRASTPGRFTYVCTRHPGMTGTLIVHD